MKLGLAAIASLGLVLIGLVVVYGRSSHASSTNAFIGSVPPGRFAMPTFTLRDYDGSLVRSSDLRGKVVVLTFLDTKCKEACPIIASEVAGAWRRLSTRERSEAAAVALSSDPRDDSPANIRSFLHAQRALGTFRYLTGPIPTMKKLWHAFLILSSFESGDAATHSAPVRIYGRDGVWLATLHAGVDLTPLTLVHDLRVALNG